jgi:hypothetical protein
MSLQFKNQVDCDKFFDKAKKASESMQVKPRPSKAITDREKRLRDKIHRLEKANEGLMKRIRELERK